MKIDYNMIKDSKLRDNFTNLTYKTHKLDFPKKSNGDTMIIKRLNFEDSFN